MAQPLVPSMDFEQLNKINDALEQIKEAKRQAELAQRAGIDVNTDLESILDSEKKLLRIKSVYFPAE